MVNETEVAAMATIQATWSQDINDTESAGCVYCSIYWESEDKESKEQV